MPRQLEEGLHRLGAAPFVLANRGHIHHHPILRVQPDRHETAVFAEFHQGNETAANARGAVTAEAYGLLSYAPVQARTALAGAARGIVRWVTLRKRWQDGAASLLVGSICALYVGPFVTPRIKPIVGDLAPNGDSNGFASLIVGLGGISIVGLLIDLIPTRATKAKEVDDAQG